MTAVLEYICLYTIDCILRVLGEGYNLIVGLCERVKEQDKALLERTLPVLQQRLHKTGAALTDCSMVSERIQEWQVLFYYRSTRGHFQLGIFSSFINEIINKISLKCKQNYIKNEKKILIGIYI